MNNYMFCKELYENIWRYISDEPSSQNRKAYKVLLTFWEATVFNCRT